MGLSEAIGSDCCHIVTHIVSHTVQCTLGARGRSVTQGRAREKRFEFFQENAGNLDWSNWLGHRRKHCPPGKCPPMNIIVHRDSAKIASSALSRLVTILQQRHSSALSSLYMHTVVNPACVGAGRATLKLPLPPPQALPFHGTRRIVLVPSGSDASHLQAKQTSIRIRPGTALYYGYCLAACRRMLQQRRLRIPSSSLPS